MKTNFNQDVVDRVQQITGLTGELLDFTVAAATITAIIGKYPTKVDMCTYIGMSEREIDALMQNAIDFAWTDERDEKVSLRGWFSSVGLDDKPRAKAMIYAVATDLVTEGLVENSTDGDGRARQLIKTIASPQQIQTKAAFGGYMVTLEYLRHISRGFDTSLAKFMKGRYGDLKRHNALAAFADVVAQNNPESFDDANYGLVINRLLELLKICD